ncbi:Lactate racemase [bioreactor metagenome]|uniref:Lactate racemase n=1 Tax=bioreactor metagenome TaxID=1076179 RepID=A0A644TLZ5_9ZZZZ|nr:nickel-dependent lactate racemase [Negativicutes bacterium]
MKHFDLAFGRQTVNFSLPEENILEVIEGKTYSPITNVEAAVKEVLRNPIDSPPLKEVVEQGEKVTIIASDMTRSWIKHDQFLYLILNELNEVGIPDKDITLVVGLGAHRPHTHEENVAVFGQEVVDRINIVQSNVFEPENYVYMGTTSRGVDFNVHKSVADADKVILVGGIVYHWLAGFGGGRKGIMPGVASYESIQGNHSFCLSPEVGHGVNPNSDSGKTVGNPMNEDMVEMTAMINPAFLFNVILTGEGEFARFVAGHWFKAWEEGCKTVVDMYGVPIKQKADLVIASAGGYPKDINLYQGSKCVDNAAKACNENGVVILLQECPEQGEPPDFNAWFTEYEDLFEREQVLRKGFTVPGFIALKLGLIYKKNPYIIVTLPENKEFMAKAGMFPVTTMEEAMALAEEKLGRKDYKTIIMPHGGNTVPILSE